MNGKNLLRTTVLGSLLAFGIAGCGGGGSDNNSGGSAGGSGVVSTIQGDAFLSQVNTIIAANENSDLVPTDNIVITTPEDRDAAPLI